MSTTYVPLISSGTAGPLGVLHLPRLWQKVSLEATGKLASGYPGIGRGFEFEPGQFVRQRLVRARASFADRSQQPLRDHHPRLKRQESFC